MRGDPEYFVFRHVSEKYTVQGREEPFASPCDVLKDGEIRTKEYWSPFPKEEQKA